MNRTIKNFQKLYKLWKNYPRPTAAIGRKLGLKLILSHTVTYDRVLCQLLQSEETRFPDLLSNAFETTQK